MDLSTNYLGMTLRSPLVVSACPLSEKLENIQRMEAAGAAAVVLYSLFEEQIRQEREAMHHYMVYGTESFAEALTYFPEPDIYHAGTEDYLRLIENARKTVGIPIIGSLNGTTPGSWVKFARKMESAGAHALELNIYSIPTDVHESGETVEANMLEIVSAVKAAISIPVAVKLSPFFSNLAHTAHKLAVAGADGLVLFNRFYQPDIDLETLEVVPNVLLSTPQALRLPLTWVALLFGRVHTDLAATSGIHTGHDVIKMMMAGANVTMMASALLRSGIEHLGVVEMGMRKWMEEHDYASVRQMRGSVSQMNAADPSAFERAQYIRSLKTYQPRVS
ncbi:MAG: dihydroorotate dehydrogenase-like protein [Chloroflexota bacterium]|nr:dihydroorotate dehydrogenase-like protein [Chloroflexota bacterium]